MVQGHLKLYMMSILNKKLTGYLILVLIVIIGTFLRFYRLGVNPPSLNWDETSIGYNAYSILKTGHDEYGNFLPLSIRSFDDYKPPVYVYLAVPSVAIFGLNEFSVRLPAALFGSLAVIIMYLLVKETLSRFSIKQREATALFSSFFLAISPWHLQFSRAAYEGNIGLFFIILATYLFFWGLRRRFMLIFASLSFTVSIYSYHSFRLVVPIYLFALLIIFWKELLRIKIAVLLSTILFIILALPVYTSFIIPNSTQARLSMVSIFSESDALKESAHQLQLDKENGNYLGMFINNRRMFFARETVKGYLDHFNPNFLFIYGAGSFHHHAANFGMLYLWELPVMLVGIYFLVKKINKKILTFFVLLFLAPIAAAITTGTPHGVRAIAMIPALILFSAMGSYFLYMKIMAAQKILKFSLTIIIVGLLMLNFAYYLNQYYVVTPRVYGYFWQYGNKQAIEEISKMEKEKEKDRIIMSYKYDQPYIYYLFYRKIDPDWYQNNWNYQGNGETERFRRVIGKYEFRNINYSEDIKLRNSLLIGIPEEIPQEAKIISEIRFPDGRIAYKIIATEK